MEPGDLVAERFVIEGLAGKGGMGAVYRATDRHSGSVVALKVLAGEASSGALHFAREAEVLAELRHPAVVRYVAHGRTSGGALYLAMEWLDGEDLAERLARAGLTMGESVALAVRAAEALGAAHAMGVVHRDVKPSNLFLPGGEIQRAKVLDFGIARITGRSRAVTLTGTMLGTPGYMSPEQARRDRSIDPRADVFSLGCVLFECLAGRAAFTGEDALALLAKILLEEAPRVAALRRGVPGELDDLVRRMLAKSPGERPADGAAVAAELRALGALEGTAPAPIGARVVAMTGGERRLISVVLAVAGERRSLAPSPDALARIAAHHGAQVDLLRDGSVFLALAGSGAATDQAARAARVALALHEVVPTRPMALATGHGEVAAGSSVGEVIDRAARLVRPVLSRGRIDTGRVTERSGPPRQGSVMPERSVAPAEIRIDEVTAGLLGARFELGGDADRQTLVGERRGDVASRTLLGRAMPLVGREPELGALSAVLSACVEEGVGRAVLVTAPPGVGKSRLLAEFLDDVRRRTPRIEVWVGEGDPMRAGAPFGILASAVRGAAQIVDSEPLAARRRKLRRRVSRHLAKEDVSRVVEFLGEMTGIPFGDSGSVQLRAARQDAILMGDQVRRAWEDWLAAELAVQPVLIVLEDFHWGDLPTAGLIDGALRRLDDRPLLVVALARPEIHAQFPRLWEGRGLQEIRVPELGRRAAERLVRRALGDRADDATVGRIVEVAGGNAFYLEELIRAVARGAGDSLPATVLAMVEARLESLSAEARRVLRAASVFGEVCWLGGVAALLGGEDQLEASRDWLADLVDREVLSRREGSRFPFEVAYGFRHSLLREGAYATLTERNRALGHRLCGEWLEKKGEREPVVLAQHYELGGEPRRAAPFFRAAAEVALDGNDFAATIGWAERAIACGAEGEALGALRLLSAEAHRWRGEIALAEAAGEEAMRWLPPRSRAWFNAAAEVAVASGRLGRNDRLVGLAAELAATASGGRIGGPQVIAMARTALQLLHAGRYELAVETLERIERLATKFATHDPRVAARIFAARATREKIAGDPGTYLGLQAAAAEAFDRAGDIRSACAQRGNVGFACLELGSYADAERALREALATAERMGLVGLAAAVRNNLGLALSMMGAGVEARRMEMAAIETFLAQGDRRMEGSSRLYLARILAAAGDIKGAEEEAGRAIAILEVTPPGRAHALGVLAGIRLLRGEADGALAAAREAMDVLTDLGGIAEGESVVRLAWAEALHATGDHARAIFAIDEAAALVLARADRIIDPEWRACFLAKVPENARIQALAADWSKSQTVG